MTSDSDRVTSTLNAHTRGNPEAAAALMPLVYDELRRLAAHYMRGERGGHTLQATALVNEAYLRMVDITRMNWQGKTHFFAMAATQMRRILVDHARAKSARKRDGQRVTLNEADAVDLGDRVDLLALDEAMEKLARKNPRCCKVAEMRLFAGLSVEETAFVLGVSERTVKNDWRLARARLMQDLEA
jgi:RNA polymerase sigma factor (TIGR02999 family)